jgi:hypothetical protein
VSVRKWRQAGRTQKSDAHPYRRSRTHSLWYHRTGILHNLRPDVAILAAAGRGTIDGEPIQGTLAQFVAQQADLLRPQRVILAHHDNWLPGFSIPTRIAPIREEMARRTPRTQLVELGYLSGYPLFDGLR